MKIECIKPSQFDSLQNFPPLEWNFDIVKFLKQHFGNDYFYGFVNEFENNIAGFGNVLIHEETAWLGNIIVGQQYRNKGIGTSITKHLIDFAKKQNCKTQILIATTMGYPIYEKLGFKTSSFYHFFKDISLNEKPDENRFRLIQLSDYDNIFELDQYVTGEKRKNIVQKFIQNGIIHINKQNETDGFYLPEFGNGLIIAINDEAGLNLLKYKHFQSVKTTVIPSENLIARNFFMKMGFQEDAKYPRMVYHDEVNWQPRFIFCRGTGYSG